MGRVGKERVGERKETPSDTLPGEVAATPTDELGKSCKDYDSDDKRHVSLANNQKQNENKTVEGRGRTETRKQGAGVEIDGFNR